MKNTLLALLAISLTACTTTPRNRDTYDAIVAELNKSLATQKPVLPEAVSAALLPPLPIARPAAEQRFNVSMNNVPAARFFTSLAAGTRYNILAHPDVSGTISAHMKDVTLFEVLDAIRELYGYDYAVDGNRILIKPLTMQTRVFQVNYLTGKRVGSSETRVNAGSLSAPGAAGAQAANGTPGAAPGSASSAAGGGVRVADSSKVTSLSSTDFWSELLASLQAIIGIADNEGAGPAAKDGRSVVVSPQSGVVVVRAMPEGLRNVAAYLKAAQLSVDRQVILEAKILEVSLNDTYQTGINWAAFNSHLAAGFVAPGTSLQSAAASAATTPRGSLTGALNTTHPATGVNGNTIVSGTTGAALNVFGNAAGSLFSVAFQTDQFASLLNFLETQGQVHVLSSPRIATMNNQKAVLKVGTDDFFVTNVSTTTNATAGNSVTTPSITLQPFFSGVVLDVTPQIDEGNNILLHVHPSVSQVTTANKVIDLGAALGTLNLPLASSNSSETDSIVRGKDGQIIAIGGLIRQGSTADKSQIPGAGDIPGLGSLFRSTNQVTQKRELVILLKPTVVQGSSTWNSDILGSQQRMQALEPKIVPGLW